MFTIITKFSNRIGLTYEYEYALKFNPYKKSLIFRFEIWAIPLMFIQKNIFGECSNHKYFKKIKLRKAHFEIKKN